MGKFEKNLKMDWLANKGSTIYRKMLELQHLGGISSHTKYILQKNQRNHDYGFLKIDQI